ncbi:MAG: uridine kinase, partial [Streblomastix strix]
MKTTSRENSDVNTDKLEQNQQLIRLFQPDAVHMFLDDEHSYTTDVSDSPGFIADAGWTASGKTSFREKVIEYLDRHRIAQPGKVVIITHDCFFRNLTPVEQILAAHSYFDFDSPGAFDFALIHQTLQKLQSGRKVRIPQYDFKTNSRCEIQWTEIGRVDVVILEGIFALCDEYINKLMSLKLFVESDSDTPNYETLFQNIPPGYKLHSAEIMSSSIVFLTLRAPANGLSPKKSLHRRKGVLIKGLFADQGFVPPTFDKDDPSFIEKLDALKIYMI